MNSLAAEHVLVTGAGRGIGAAIAAAAARAGAAVTCLDLDVDAAAGVAAGIVDTGAQAVAVGCDLTSVESLDRALERCEEELSPVTVLIANAGGAAGDSTPFLELTAHQWHAMIDRNLTTAFHCGLALGRRFDSRGGGTMVFVTSFTAEIAPAGLVHYSAAKGGVRQLVRGMAHELGPHGIRVNAVAPGFVATEGNRATLGDPNIAAGIQRRVPLRRIGEPADVAAAAIYLASADSGYVTGAMLMVDGGWLVRDYSANSYKLLPHSFEGRDQMTQSMLLDAPAVAGLAQLTDFDEIDEILRSRKFVQGAYQGSKDNLMRDTLTLLDGPRHLQRRRILGKLFSGDAMLGYREQHLMPVVERTVAELAALDRDADGAVHTDLVGLIQRCLYRVGAAITGIDGLEDPEVADRFIGQVQAIAAGCTVDWAREDPDVVMKRAFAARAELERTLYTPSLERRRELIAGAEADGIGPDAIPKDMITLLLLNWDPSWDDELPLREVSVFLVGATQTTAGSLVLLVLRLEEWFTRHPDQRRLVADGDFLRRAAFESLRMTVAAPARIRVATEDVTLASGRQIKAGERVALLFLPANMEVERFGPDAAEFNPWRELDGKTSWGHAFGGGAHACLGRPMVTGIRSGPDDAEGTVAALARMLYAAGMELSRADLPVPDQRTFYSTYVNVPVRFTAV